MASTLARRVASVRDAGAVQASFDPADAVEASDCGAFDLDLEGVVVAAFGRAGRAAVAFGLAEEASGRAALVRDAIEAASTWEVSKLVAYLAACWDDAPACLEAVAAAVAASAAEVLAAVVAFEVAAERAVIRSDSTFFRFVSLIRAFDGDCHLHSVKLRDMKRI